MHGINRETEKVLITLSESDLFEDYTLIGGTSIEYSRNKLKLKAILSILSNAERFRKEENFELLNPKYNVTFWEIRDYIIDRYKEETSDSK